MYVVVFSLHDNLSNVMTTKSIHDVVAGIALFFSTKDYTYIERPGIKTKLSGGKRTLSWHSVHHKSYAKDYYSKCM